MKLEPIIQSEVSQKNTSMLTHIYGIQKDGDDDPVCEIVNKRHRCKEQTLDSVGEGKGGMI